jgi:hypothetical protein
MDDKVPPCTEPRCVCFEYPCPDCADSGHVYPEDDLDDDIVGCGDASCECQMTAEEFDAWLDDPESTGLPLKRPAE